MRVWWKPVVLTFVLGALGGGAWYLVQSAHAQDLQLIAHDNKIKEHDRNLRGLKSMPLDLGRIQTEVEGIKREMRKIDKVQVSVDALRDVLIRSRQRRSPR